jgi:hypothetical protein
MVWVPKRRRKIVYGKLRKEIGEILRRLNEYKDVDVIEGKACYRSSTFFWRYRRQLYERQPEPIFYSAVCCI